MYDLNEIAVFAKVVEASSFSGGARQLGLPKATVSRKVAELEARLGIRLLERTTRKLRLTEEGREYYLRCNQHIAAIEEANDAISDARTEPRGTLRISMPRAGQRFMCELLVEFMALYPKLKVDVLLSEEIIDLIAENIDLAVRAGYLEDSSLIARNLGPTEPLICASPAYLEEYGVPNTPQDLCRHECIILNTTADNILWRFHGPNGPESVQISGRLQANDINFVMCAVISGLGIARLPSFMAASHIEAGRLCTILDDCNPTFGSVYIVYPSRRHLSAKVRAFLDFVEKRVKPTPPWLPAR